VRRRRVWAGLGLTAAALVVHTGWGRGERPWRDATGWRRVPQGERPPGDLPWPATAGEAPRLAWLGHAGFLLEWRGARLLVDPNLSPRCTLVRRELEIPARPEELGAVDAVLVTHAHFDHLDRPTLAALPGIGRLLVPAGTEGYVAGLRPEAEVTPLAEGEAARIGALEVVAVPAFHHGNRLHPLASRKRAVGWIVRNGETSIYFAGDTGATNDFDAIGAQYRPVLAVLPIGAFSPPWPIGRVHLSPEQAVAAAERLGRPLVVPGHFGTFALALDRPGAALPRFARAAAAKGVVWRMPALLVREPQ